MRRVCVLGTLMVLVCATLVTAGRDASARTLRKRAHPRKPAATEAATPTVESDATDEPPKSKRPRWSKRSQANQEALRPPKAAAIPKPPRRSPRGARAAQLVAVAPSVVEPIPRRLLIVGFAGGGALLVRGAAISALGHIPSVRVAPLRPTEARQIGTMYSAEKSVELAQRMNLTAVLYGEVTQARRSFRVSLILANGEDGKTVGTFAFEGRSLAAVRGKLRAQLWSKLGPLIDQAASPGPPQGDGNGVAATPVAATPPGQPETAERSETRQKPGKAGRPAPPARPRRAEVEAPDEPAQPRSAVSEEIAEPSPALPPPVVRRRSGPSAESEAPIEEVEAVGEGGAAVHAPARRPCALAEIEPTAGVMVRRFNYRDEQRGALRAYNLYRAPAGGVEGTIFPFADQACGLKARLGLRLAYERMAPVTSQLADRRLGTQASAYQAEVTLRIPRGALTLQPALGYFVRQYSVDQGVVPAASYRALGASLDAGLRIGIVTIELGAGARRLIGAGVLESADWFPGLSALAVSGRGRLGVAVNDWIDVLAGGSLEYYSFDFKVAPSGAYPNGVASGAYDVYLQGGVSARFRLGVRRPPPMAQVH